PLPHALPVRLRSLPHRGPGNEGGRAGAFRRVPPARRQSGPGMSDLELCHTGAKKLARLIRTRKVSATEVMRAFIARIERVNPKVNAIVTFLPELALKRA